MRFDHFADGIFVVVGFVVAGNGTLPQPVVALSGEEERLVEAIASEGVVDIRGDDEVVGVSQTVQDGPQILIEGEDGGVVAVGHDVSGPVRPPVLRRWEGIEPGGVHVAQAELLDEVREEAREAGA